MLCVCKRLRTVPFERSEPFHLLRMMGVSVPSLHIESTDSMIRVYILATLIPCVAAYIYTAFVSILLGTIIPTSFNILFLHFIDACVHVSTPGSKIAIQHKSPKAVLNAEKQTYCYLSSIQ